MRATPREMSNARDAKTPPSRSVCALLTIRPHFFARAHDVVHDVVHDARRARHRAPVPTRALVARRVAPARAHPRADVDIDVNAIHNARASAPLPPRHRRARRPSRGCG